eukprot:4555283-Alexandrium_andersonii.AAC.1
MPPPRWVRRPPRALRRRWLLRRPTRGCSCLPPCPRRGRCMRLLARCLATAPVVPAVATLAAVAVP